MTPNPEMVVAAQTDPKFMKSLQSADLSIPDGWGVVAAMRLLEGQGTRAKGQGKKLNGYSFSPHPLALILSRISGISLMLDLIVLAARHGWRVMLVGGKPGVAAYAAQSLSRRTKAKGQGTRESNEIPSALSPQPSAFTIHALSAPPDILHVSPDDLNHLITSINKIKPDLLFVAFGHGKQEKWMVENRERLQVGVMMGVGGALDQVVDPSLRPPAIIDSIGLSWLYRLVREPWRWRRQLSLLTFAWMVFYRRVWFKEE